MLRRAAAHKGSALRRDLPELQRLQRRRLRRGQGADGEPDPARARRADPFGAEGERGVKLRRDGSCELVDVARARTALLVHDEHQEVGSLAFALSRISHTPHGPTPIGIFRDVERPVYDELMAEQLDTAKAERGEGDLKALLHAGDTWTV